MLYWWVTWFRCIPSLRVSGTVRLYCATPLDVLKRHYVKVKNSLLLNNFLKFLFFFCPLISFLIILPLFPLLSFPLMSSDRGLGLPPQHPVNEILLCLQWHQRVDGPRLRLQLRRPVRHSGADPAVSSIFWWMWCCSYYYEHRNEIGTVLILHYLGSWWAQIFLSWHS